MLWVFLAPLARSSSWAKGSLAATVAMRRMELAKVRSRSRSKAPSGKRRAGSVWVTGRS